MLNTKEGLTGEACVTVDDSNTAIAACSGSLPVFGTPFMIALMEKATCEAVASILEEGETTVGTKIEVDHSRATGIGAVVTAQAVLTAIDRRKLTFRVSAHDDSGNTIGGGVIERFVVNDDKFMEKVGA